MSGGQKATSGYQPTGQPQADVNYQALTASQFPYAQNLPGQVVPQAQQLTQGIVSNPYAQQQQTGINTTAGIGASQIAPQAYAGSANLQNLGNVGGQSGYANQILQQGFDPQQALYAQQYQQMIDQQNAINSMYGIQNSPYGAGVTGQAAQNFNLDWLNNQMAREQQAITGYGNLVSGAGNAYAGAANLGNVGLQTGTTAANLPYQTYAGNLGTGVSALGNYSGLVGSSIQPGQSELSDLAAYLGLGQSATGLQQQAAQINNQANASAFGGLGSLFGTVFGGLTAPFGGTSIMGGW